jgi:hypothetical protein
MLDMNTIVFSGITTSSPNASPGCVGPGGACASTTGVENMIAAARQIVRRTRVIDRFRADSARRSAK